MKIQQINNTNFQAQLWPKNNLVKFQKENLIKNFTERTKAYPELILEQTKVSNTGADTFTLYDKNLNKLFKDNFECYRKYSTPEKLLEEYDRIFYTMINKAEDIGIQI